MTAEKVERARLAFGDALSSRVSMDLRLGDVPVEVLRVAMAEALMAIADAQQPYHRLDHDLPIKPKVEESESIQPSDLKALIAASGHIEADAQLILAELLKAGFHIVRIDSSDHQTANEP